MLDGPTNIHQSINQFYSRNTIQIKLCTALLNSFLEPWRGILVGSVQCVTLGQKENQIFVSFDYLILMKKYERYIVNI